MANGIKAVAMDMWEPYISVFRLLLPNFDKKIVFDKFHIVGHMNNAVDIVRRAENRALRAEGDERLVGSKHMWLYGEENLPERYITADFASLRRANLKTSRAWAIKETLRELWDQPSRKQGEAWYKRWDSWAIRCRLQPVKKVAKMIRNHLHGVMSYFKHRITSHHQLHERGLELHDSDDQEARFQLSKLRQLPRRDPVSLWRPGATPIIGATQNPEETKKELVGEFKNAGSEWQPEGHPVPVRVHDFIDDSLGKAIPYGVYDLTNNTGWVNVGIDHDTPAFAVRSIAEWWKCMASEPTPTPKRF